MGVVVTSPGTVEVWRGRTRVYSGRPSAALQAELAKLVGAKADRTAAYTVRLPVYSTVQYTKPVVGSINLGGELPR